jgi:hypothetical protein
MNRNTGGESLLRTFFGQGSIYEEMGDNQAAAVPGPQNTTSRYLNVHATARTHPHRSIGVVSHGNNQSVASESEDSDNDDGKFATDIAPDRNHLKVALDHYTDD